jgi:FKBP-type peptidyl-prolyl cis-trans isomerase SlyD
MSRRLIEFDYLLKNSNGEVLDNSKDADGEPMRYIEGSSQIIPGLESRMKNLKKGDKKEITVPAAEAYGEREAKLVIEVPLDQFPKNQKVTVGLQVEIEVAENYYHPFTVTKMGQSHATLDGNHELAGEDLHFSVEVKEAREATAAEIAESEAEHEHVHGENCSH